jgi:hypothetical protein
MMNINQKLEIFFVKLSKFICIMVILSWCNNLFASNSKVVLLTPEQLRFRNEGGQNILDLALNQRIQTQFNNLIETLKSLDIEVIVGVGRDESENSANVNWFKIYSHNNERSIIIFPGKESLHNSNSRMAYIKHLLSEQEIIVNKELNYWSERQQKNFLDFSDIVFDENYRHIYFNKAFGFNSYTMINNISKKIGVTCSEIDIIFDKQARAIQTLRIQDYYAFICKECFRKQSNLDDLLNKLKRENKVLIEITKEQALAHSNDFFILYANQKKFMLISERAYAMLTTKQIAKLKDIEIVKVNLSAFYRYNNTSLTDIISVVR